MKDELTVQEQAAKEILETRFIPALHHILETSNPEEYKKWGGNACRQTAVFGVKMLEKLLPDYTWEAWDGIFNDKVYDKDVRYNHAWIYGVNKATNRRLLVDLSRIHHERLFMKVFGNKYPKNHPSYKHMREVKREKMDIEKRLEEEEYYTNLPSHSLLQELMTIVLD